ncbi:LuxR C-terminal-related transcriptional regulator [Variovorax sp. EL159]|uniref:LuxR C-terminal-related transcriptional regulator n=1 Tax=Variovorax sp. EL159 TaxID=1566270 RepID=UPI000888707C|nr:LuxR C-terminal-related transcriptional regulator [Variovorax sp. EL159]SCX66159.1 LuxR family transcriptional regulator, maltose regulon positive regulatory protein [Variovorax sp. EL159]
MDESLNNSLAVASDRRIEPVASTKLLPPRPSRRLVPRDALQARLLEARRQRCVVVQGPAGSGKTSTLVAWRQALLALDFDVAWLSLSAEDCEPTRFFDCLLASIGEVDPDAVREAALLMGRDSDESALEHAVITVVQAISSRPRELVLMLDDLQHLEDARIFQVLQWLLDYAPPKLHLAFASRNALPLSFARLRSQGLVSEFDLRDLRFTAEETEHFLREQLGSIDKRDVQVLHELTDGWVAGLQLFVVDMQAKQGAAYARVQVRDAQAFASYFEGEVLAHLPPEELALLTRLAVCNRFCASLCAALLALPHAGAGVGMALRLARMDSENLFISQVSSHDREIWYRVHPLLREILLARLERLPGDERRALHGAAWRWFEAHGHFDEAVRHAVLAGDAHAAADIVEACAFDLLAGGELASLGGLMRRLPATQVQARFGLRLVAAYLRLYARDIEALEGSIAQFEAEFDTLDALQRRGLTLLRGGLALQRDDTETLLAIAPQLEAIPDDAQAIFAGRNHLLAWMHMYRDAYAEARTLLEDAAQQYAPSTGRGLVGRCLAGMSYALEGRMTEAEHLFREVLQEAQGHGAARIGAASMAAGLQSDVLYEWNELEAACSLLAPRIEVLERASIPDAVLRAFVVLACAHWLAGRRLEALDHLDHLEDYAVRNGLDRLLAHALVLRMRLYLKQGETAQADQVFERIKVLNARHADADKGTAAETWRITERARADMCLHWNDFDGAVDCLKPLIECTAAAGRLRILAALRLQLAIAEAGRGNRRPARQQAIEALRLGHRLGLVRSLLDVSANVPSLLDALLADAALDPVLAFYAQRLVDAAATTRRARAGAGVAASAAAEGVAVDLLNEREREVLDLVAQAMPNKKIARVLGVTPHTVKWHLRKIYSKLGVAERDEAVARMRDLSLLRETPKPR